MLEISHLSVEYVKIPVTGPVELSALTVEMAIQPQGEIPETGDWETATWFNSHASILIGTGTTIGALTRGVTYGVWVRITSLPEMPVLGPYDLHIT